MDLKEYFLIIKEKAKIFFAVIILFIAGTFIYFFFRPISFETSLFLNITRAGKQISDGYKYDNFYRLQADEKFAETIVKWLESPRVVTDINNEVGKNTESLSLKQLAKFFQANKLSSQVVSVKFSAPDKKTAEKIAVAVFNILKKNTDQLNEDQKEDAWFEIKAQDPIIIQTTFDYKIIFLVSLLVGVFLGFWVVLFRHYLE
jgi:capsular polysaccharide biosynthesis protein